MDKCRFKDIQGNRTGREERMSDGQMVEEGKKGKRKISNILIKD